MPMSASAAAYGFTWGLLFFLLDKLNSPVAWVLFWGVGAVQLTVFATLTWQRTRMAWTTICAAHAALVMVALVPASLAGYTLNNLPPPWNVVFWVNALAVPLVLSIAWLDDREKYRLWKQHQQGMSLLDELSFRHIPRLR
jgi:hypothetical protein